MQGRTTMTADRTRSKLAWRLTHPKFVEPMDCVVITRRDKRVEVLIERGNVQEAFGVFTDARTAARVVSEFKAAMTTRGWRKVSSHRDE